MSDLTRENDEMQTLLTVAGLAAAVGRSPTSIKNYLARGLVRPVGVVKRPDDSLMHLFDQSAITDLRHRLELHIH